MLNDSIWCCYLCRLKKRKVRNSVLNFICCCCLNKLFLWASYINLTTHFCYQNFNSFSPSFKLRGTRKSLSQVMNLNSYKRSTGIRNLVHFTVGQVMCQTFDNVMSLLSSLLHLNLLKAESTTRLKGRGWGGGREVHLKEKRATRQCQVKIIYLSDNGIFHLWGQTLIRSFSAISNFQHD